MVVCQGKQFLGLLLGLWAAIESGIIYIDHERNELYYNKTREYIKFLKIARKKFDFNRYLRLLLDVKGYHHIIRRLLNSR